MLRSEEVRKLAPEMDPLRMRMGWKRRSVQAAGHGGKLLRRQSSRLRPSEYIRGRSGKGRMKMRRAARYFATDMCDGIARGHDGINCSWHIMMPLRNRGGTGQCHSIRWRCIHSQL